MLCVMYCEVLELMQEGSREIVLQAGDLVLFPKWLVVEVAYRGEYEQRHKYYAYGDDM